MLVIAIDVSNNDNFTGLSRTNITTNSLLVEHCIGITEVMVQLPYRPVHYCEGCFQIHFLNRSSHK